VTMPEVIDKEKYEEGKRAYGNRAIYNPYADMSEMGSSWHLGWLAAAGINNQTDLRLRLTSIETMRDVAYAVTELSNHMSGEEADSYSDQTILLLFAVVTSLATAYQRGYLNDTPEAVSFVVDNRYLKEVELMSAIVDHAAEVVDHLFDGKEIEKLIDGINKAITELRKLQMK